MPKPKGQAATGLPVAKRAESADARASISSSGCAVYRQWKRRVATAAAGQAARIKEQHRQREVGYGR